MYNDATRKLLRKKRIMSNIADTTGLNNVSKSSVLGQLVDALTETIDDASNFVNDGIRSTFTNYADGALLTANAYEFGVIRNIVSDFYILGRDKVAKIVMTDGSSFPKYMDGQVVIPKGARYTIGEGTVIEILENVIPQYNSTEVYIDFRVMPATKTDISPGSKIDLSNPKFPITAGLSLEITASVYTTQVLETDESLRRRTLFAKARTHGSSHSAISGIISGMPYVKNHYIRDNDRSGKTEIFVTTEEFESEGDESALPVIKSKILQTLDYLAGAEQSFDVMFPEVFKIRFEYTYANTTSDMALAAIRDSFLRSYAYSIVKGIRLEDIQEKLSEYNLDVLITKCIIYSDNKGEITKLDSKFNIPEDSYILFDIPGSVGTGV